MSEVVLGVHPTVHAAYQANLEAIGVSTTALYNKLDRVETAVSAALAIRHVKKMCPDTRVLTSFFFRALGMQIQALKRARWGSDHDISGYSGGESVFTRLLFGSLDDLQKSIDRERSIRMFLEPLICLIACLFLWQDAVAMYFFFAAPAMLFKQLREFHYMRRKQQSLHTRQEKVEWWQGLIHSKYGHANMTGSASARTATVSSPPVGDVSAMKTQMPRDLQDFMGGDKEE